MAPNPTIKAGIALQLVSALHGVSWALPGICNQLVALLGPWWGDLNDWGLLGPSRRLAQASLLRAARQQKQKLPDLLQTGLGFAQSPSCCIRGPAQIQRVRQPHGM